MKDEARSSAMKRRVLIGGAGALALAGGVGLALRGRSADEAAFETLWTRRFDTPDGATLALDSLRGRPLLINFWATWCAPCVREMPQIDRFYRDFSPKSWQVIGLAIDSPTPVREFLGRVKISFPIGLAGLEGSQLAKELGNEQGGLPFTVAFDAAGRLVQRKLGETHYEELAGWARALG